MTWLMKILDVHRGTAWATLLRDKANNIAKNPNFRSKTQVLLL